MSPELPGGTLTFLFSDVEGSTRLLKTLGRDLYGDALDAHRVLLRSAFEEAGGTEVDSQGDAFLAVFRSGGDAVRAAVAAQRALAGHDWREGTSLRVRMGIHTGEAAIGGGGYRGLAVHQGARVCSAAHGGQVLLSSTTRDLVESDLPDHVGLRDLGLAQLPDISRPERLFQLVIEGLPDAFPPPRARLSAPLLSAQVNLLERNEELSALDAVIAVSASSGRLLAIEGPPGIGKSRLVAEVKARAQRVGMEVLTARGSELEQAFSYGAMRQLFEPFLAAVSADDRTRLLEGAAGLAAPLFDPGSLSLENGADSSPAMLHGLYWLAANVAARRPLLLAIDDLHWCDAPSLRSIAYLLPRMEGLPLLIVVALRPAEPDAEHALLGRITGDPLASVVRPAPLSEEAARHLVRDVLSPDADDVFCAACHRESGGNPLLLRELTNAIAAEGLSPTGAQSEHLGELGAQAVSRSVSLRLGRLPEEAASLASAVSILGDDADPRHAAALAGLDEDTASEAAASLGRIDILRPQGSLAFVHPVVRAAVYGELTSAQRDNGHAKAAKLLEEAGAEPERVAAQLLRVRPRGDAGTVAVLRQAARDALASGAPDGAVTYLRRALQEPPGEERADVLVELGSAQLRSDPDGAAPHLREAVSLLQAPEERAEAALLLGRALYAGGKSAEAVGILEDALGNAVADSELSYRIEAELIGALLESIQHDRAMEHFERLYERLPTREGIGRRMLVAQLSTFCTSRSSREESVAFASEAVADDLLLRDETSDIFVWAAAALVDADEYDIAGAALERAFAHARRRGSPQAFVWASHFRSRLFLVLGELDDAEADARSSLEAVESYGLAGSARWAISALADVLLERGSVDEAATLVRSAPAIDIRREITPLVKTRIWLALVQGRPSDGLPDLEELQRRLNAPWGRAGPGWRQIAAQALSALGRPEEALEVAREEVEAARVWGAPRSLGRALRVAGLLESGAKGLALLAEATEVLEPSPARLERANALVEHGAGLRRANQRSAARDPLRQGLELATLCGASPLAERAETELLASGARPRRIALSGVEALTPSERRVAEMAAGGATNREIAQALFVTPKTIEVHLSSSYRKLDISSRSGLAKALAVEVGAPA